MESEKNSTEFNIAQRLFPLDRNRICQIPSHYFFPSLTPVGQLTFEWETNPIISIQLLRHSIAKKDSSLFALSFIFPVQSIID